MLASLPWREAIGMDSLEPKKSVPQANGPRLITGGYWLKTVSHQLSDDFGVKMNASRLDILEWIMKMVWAYELEEHAHTPTNVEVVVPLVLVQPLVTIHSSIILPLIIYSSNILTQPAP